MPVVIQRASSSNDDILRHCTCLLPVARGRPHTLLPALSAHRLRLSPSSLRSQLQDVGGGRPVGLRIVANFSAGLFVTLARSQKTIRRRHQLLEPRTASKPRGISRPAHSIDPFVRFGSGSLVRPVARAGDEQDDQAALGWRAAPAGFGLGGKR